jgi:hypothetical protein
MRRGDATRRTHARVGDATRLDEDDALHEFDGGEADTGVHGMRAPHELKDTRLRLGQRVPLLARVAVLAPGAGRKRGRDSGWGART